MPLPTDKTEKSKPGEGARSISDRMKDFDTPKVPPEKPKPGGKEDTTPPPGTPPNPEQMPGANPEAGSPTENATGSAIPGQEQEPVYPEPKGKTPGQMTEDPELYTKPTPPPMTNQEAGIGPGNELDPTSTSLNEVNPKVMDEMGAKDKPEVDPPSDGKPQPETKEAPDKGEDRKEPAPTQSKPAEDKPKPEEKK